ncbi:MAG: M12 family metallo-peptidase, partial [Planctomycetota bacterium]
ILAQADLNVSDPVASVMADQLGVTEAYPQRLLFDQFTDGELLVEVNLPGTGPVTLSLIPHSVRSDRFQVLVDNGNGLEPYPAPPVMTRRGRILEIPGSTVAGSFDGSSLTALIRNGNELFSIVPAKEAGYSGDSEWHVIIDDKDVIDNGELCGTSGFSSPGRPNRNPEPQSFGTTFYLTEVGIDADFEFFQQNGGSVNSTVADVENVMNATAEVYEDLSISITYEISILIVRTTSSDPYGTISSAGQLLSTFSNVWSSSPENQVPRDVAHLFTGVNLDGGTIGVAYLADICTNNAYGLSQSRFSSVFSRRVALTTHELGHNWSSSHCDSQGTCRIMCSVLNGCNGINPLSFSPAPVGQIVSYRNSRSCLSSKTPALALPFFDDFPTGSVDSNLWIYNEGGIVSSQGNGEPSGPTSLQLNRSGGGTYEYDEIRSNVILLGGTNPVLQFYSNHTGVEAGEELIVEYLSASLAWIELDRIVSTGGAPSSYATNTYTLPANARHNQFRFRFITNTNENNDNWYIDDVSVSDGPPPTLDPPLITGINPPDGSTAGGAFITITGQNFTSDVAVLLGNSLVDNLSYVSDTQLVGNVPPATVPGFVAVIASQASGSDLLNPGFLYTEEYIFHDSAEGAPGSPVAVTVSADHDTVIAGYSLAVDFDANDVIVSSITAENSVALGADFFEPAFNNDLTAGGGWWTLGAILSFTGTTSVAPSDQTILATANYILQPTVTVGSEIIFEMANGVGPAIPPSENLLVDPGGNAVPPLLEGGSIVVGANSFIRADGNNDLTVNVADAVFILNFLFSGLASDCLDSLDANDDGGNDIADAVAVLAFLFSSGPAPPPPFPNPGPDPTADSLDCNN